MRPGGAVALTLALAASAATAAAGGWEIEAMAGTLGGIRLTVPAPFELDGLSYGGPYGQCDLPGDACLLLGAGDVVYLRAEDHRWGFLGSLDIRRPIGGFSLGGGIMAALSQRRQRVGRVVLLQAEPTRPAEPENLRHAATEGDWRSRGFTALAYAYASLRREHVFGGSPSVYASPATRLGLFLDAGGGVLPSFPGHTDAPSGRPAGALHASLGARIRRRGRDVTFAVTRVQALVDTDHLTAGGFAWTIVRVGVVFER